jgi:ABC-type sugar transport system substrate-binding protein
MTAVPLKAPSKKRIAMKFKSCVAASLLALGILGAATPAFAADVHMFVRHEVADYATWRKAYDGFRATQQKLGVVAQAVYQSTDNPNDVTVTHDFKSLDKAKAFAASPELKAAMEKSGVKGAPQVWFTTKSKK